MQLPNNKQILQSNLPDNQGDIISSFGLDLMSNPGRIRLAPRLLQVASTDTNPRMTAPATNYAFYTDGSAPKFWTVAGSALHYNTIFPNTPFTTDAVSLPYPVDSTVSDVTDFAGNLIVATQNSNVLQLLYRPPGATTYTSAYNVSTGTTNNFLGVYAQRLYFLASPTTIYSMTSGYTIASSGSYTTGLSDDIQITCILFGRNKIWIGAMNQIGKKGGIYLWDGQQPTTLARYPIIAQGVLSGVLKDDNPYFMDTDGALIGFNGVNFTEVDRLPLDGKFLANFSSNINNRPIHPRGMEVVGKRINVLVNGVIGDGSITSRCPSGIWELDDNNKLYHKYSIDYTPINSSGIADYGQHRLVNVGALKEIKANNPSTNANGTFLTSASFYKPDGTTTTAIFTNDSNDTVQKYGHFTTAWFDAGEIDEKLQRIYVRQGKLLSSTDKISVKYRLDKKDPIELPITWLNPSQFTTTTDVTSYKTFECEITQGGGGGYCSKISNVVFSAGVSTVTLAENVNVNGTGTIGKARFQYWIEAGAPLQNINRNFIEYTIGKTFTSAQIKVCMLFTDKNEVYGVSTADKQFKPNA